MSWFIRQKGEKQGPLEEVHVRKMISSGQVGPQDEIWDDIHNAWRPISEVDAFADEFHTLGSQNPQAVTKVEKPEDRVAVHEQLYQETAMHPCVVHADKPAHGPCGKCMRDFCDECLKAVADGRPLCRECRAEAAGIAPSVPAPRGPAFRAGLPAAHEAYPGMIMLVWAVAGLAGGLIVGLVTVGLQLRGWLDLGPGDLPALSSTQAAGLRLGFWILEGLLTGLVLAGAGRRGWVAGAAAGLLIGLVFAGASAAGGAWLSRDWVRPVGWVGASLVVALATVGGHRVAHGRG